MSEPGKIKPRRLHKLTISSKLFIKLLYHIIGVDFCFLDIYNRIVMVKKKVNYRRVLHYFWKALITQKMILFLLLIFIPIRIFISNVVVSYGTSEIIGKLSGGDFEIENYIGILLLTLVPAVINNLAVMRVIDWLDYLQDAKCGKYLALIAFDAVINQSMTFHSNRFSGSLTSAANKLPRAFIQLKSNVIWDAYPLALTMIFSIVMAGIVCLPFALILAVYAAVYIAVAVTTYYKTLHVDAKIA